MNDDDHHAPAFIDLDSRKFFGMTAPKLRADTMEYLAILKQRFGDAAVDVTVALIALSEDMDELQKYFNDTLEQELAGLRTDDALFEKLRCDLNMLSVDVKTLQDTPDSVAFLLLQIKPDVFKRILDDSRLSQHRAALKAMTLAVLNIDPQNHELLNKLRNAGVNAQMLGQDAELHEKVRAAGGAALDILNTASAHAAIVEPKERKDNDSDSVKVFDFENVWVAVTSHRLQGFDEVRDKRACKRIYTVLLLLCFAIVQHIGRLRSPHKIDFTRKALLTALRALFGSEESKTLRLEGCTTNRPRARVDGTSDAIYFFVARFMEGFCTLLAARETKAGSSLFWFWRLKDPVAGRSALEQAVAKLGQSTAAATTAATAMAKAAEQAYQTAFAQPMYPGIEFDVTATKNTVDTRFGDKAFLQQELINQMKWSETQRKAFDPDDFDLHLVQLPAFTTDVNGNTEQLGSCFGGNSTTILCRKAKQNLVDLVAAKQVTDEVMKGLSVIFKVHFLLSKINSRDIDDMIELVKQVEQQQVPQEDKVVHLLGLLFTRTQLLWADFSSKGAVQFPARDRNGEQTADSSTTPEPRFVEDFINIEVTMDTVPDNKDDMGANWANYVFTFECRGGKADGGVLSVRVGQDFWFSAYPFCSYLRCDACPEWLQLLLGKQRKNSFTGYQFEKQLPCANVTAFVYDRVASAKLRRSTGEKVYEKQRIPVPGWSGDALKPLEPPGQPLVADPPFRLLRVLEQCKAELGGVAPDAAVVVNNNSVTIVSNNNNGANDDDENFVADANRRGAARAADSGVGVGAAAASAGVRREREDEEPATAAAAAAAAAAK